MAGIIFIIAAWTATNRVIHTQHHLTIVSEQLPTSSQNFQDPYEKIKLNNDLVRKKLSQTPITEERLDVIKKPKPVLN